MRMKSFKAAATSFPSPIGFSTIWTHVDIHLLKWPRVCTCIQEKIGHPREEFKWKDTMKWNKWWPAYMPHSRRTSAAAHTISRNAACILKKNGYARLAAKCLASELRPSRFEDGIPLKWSSSACCIYYITRLTISSVSLLNSRASSETAFFHFSCHSL